MVYHPSLIQPLLEVMIMRVLWIYSRLIRMVAKMLWVVCDLNYVFIAIIQAYKSICRSLHIGVISEHTHLVKYLWGASYFFVFNEHRNHSILMNFFMTATLVILPYQTMSQAPPPPNPSHQSHPINPLPNAQLNRQVLPQRPPNPHLSLRLPNLPQSLPSRPHH